MVWVDVAPSEEVEIMNRFKYTLQQWCDRNKILPTHPTTETKAVSLLVDQTVIDRDQLWDLHHLRDYNVTSVCGIVVWLKPCADRARGYPK
jgi:hypothetical protein